MSLGLNPEQQDLSDAVAKFAERHAPIAATRDSFDALAAGQLPVWWDALVSNGFHAVHLPEHLGGQGGRLLEAACVLESAGKTRLPGPLLPTVGGGSRCAAGRSDTGGGIAAARSRIRRTGRRRPSRRR